MKIVESYGIVNNHSWDDLCLAIAEYIYDPKDGLNADPFYDDDNSATITLKNVNSYYKYKFHKSIDEYIPFWIGNVEILCHTENKINGSFVRNSAQLENEKMNFIINLSLTSNVDKELVKQTIVHEFRHAYSKYLELTKNIKIKNASQKNLYDKIVDKIQDNSYKAQLVKEIHPDYIVIDNTIYQNSNRLYSAILYSLYYIDIDEIHSYCQSYSYRLDSLFKRYAKEIDDLIQNNGQIKNFDKLSALEKYNSRILNKMPFNQYNCTEYRCYKAYQLFWENIDNIPEDILIEVISRLEKILNIFLYGKNFSRDIVKYFDNLDGSFNGAHIAINRIKKKVLKEITETLEKMDNIYAQKIINKSSQN